jgi:sensor histidine kinase YesM
VWTLVGLFQFTDDLKTTNHSIRYDLFAIEMMVAYISAFATPVAITLARWFPIERPKLIRHAVSHVVFSVGFAVCIVLVFSGITLALGVGKSIMRLSFVGVFVPGLVSGIYQHTLTYWVIIGVSHANRYHYAFIERDRRTASLELRASELKTVLRQAQLHALKAQLEPHFLFNTLNAIMVLVRQENEAEAIEMLRRLRELLDCVLRDADAQEVPLNRELEYLRLYLAIEQVRFRDRLCVEISVESEVYNAAVAHMCLQPLVENAIRHGVARSSMAGMIRISASREQDRLKLQIQDDGPGFQGVTPPRRFGIGLANTKARLDRLYGESASLNVEHLPRGGTIATIVVPYHALA